MKDNQFVNKLLDEIFTFFRVTVGLIAKMEAERAHS